MFLNEEFAASTRECSFLLFLGLLFGFFAPSSCFFCSICSLMAVTCACVQASSSEFGFRGGRGALNWYVCVVDEMGKGSACPLWVHLSFVTSVLRSYHEYYSEL